MQRYTQTKSEGMEKGTEARKLKNISRQMEMVTNILECKNRKSKNTRSNRQIWPWSTKWSRAKANRVRPRECTGHSKHPLPTTQERVYTWASPDGQHQNQIDYVLCSQGWRSSIQSAKQDRELTGSDHELFIAKFKLSEYMLSFESGWGAQYINYITPCMQHNTILPLL